MRPGELLRVVLLSLFGCIPVAMLKGPGVFLLNINLGVRMDFFLFLSLRLLNFFNWLMFRASQSPARGFLCIKKWVICCNGILTHIDSFIKNF